MGRRGTKPKPTALHELSGAYQKNPQRRNTLEPIPIIGAPVCPQSVRDDERAMAKWNSTLDLLDQMKILTLAEVDVLEAYCLAHSAVERYRKDLLENGSTYRTVDAQGNTIIKANPAFNHHARANEMIIKLMPQLGLTPSGRASLKVNPTPEEEDPLAALAKIA